ncbi:hypothetical protein BKA70DRAFT_1559236 [Coprinopsis sp. MPI-PUGE-AT-0042]|nr:hypothetical protein BKA70DRAFT_1559236 [Coprinopsis sp. MPI-PUGE-AT-0042]
MPFASIWQRPPLRVLLVSLFASRCVAMLVNATIDDTFGDTRSGAGINYSPPAAWRDGRLPCPVCRARPTSSLLYNGTWHDSTFKRNDPNDALKNVPRVATARFNGTGIYVYCALARSDDPGFATRSDMTFYIDGQEMGTFRQGPLRGDGFDYDALVYENTALAPRDHEFVLQNGRPDAQDSLVLLDRIVYTYDDGKDDGSSNDDSNEGGSKSGPNLAAIIGGTLGGVAVLCLSGVGIAFWILKRRQRQLSEKNSLKVKGNLVPTPYPIFQVQHRPQAPISTFPYTPSIHTMSNVASSGIGSSSGHNASISHTSP